MSTMQEIVAAVDFRSESKAALARAQYLATQFSAKLHLVHGVPKRSFAMSHDLSALPGSWRAAEESAAKDMAELAAALRAEGIELTTQVSDLDPVHAVLAAAEEHGADAIVMGTHGYTGLKHAILGSVAEGVLRQAACPVITVREDEANAAAPIRRIVAGTDLSTNSEPAVTWAFQLASHLGADIELVHVFSFQADAFPHTEEWDREVADKERAQVERVQAQCDAHRGDRPAEIRVLTGDSPAALIARRAADWEADLLVLGTHGYTGLRSAILGRVAQEALHRASCSVATLKADS